MIEPKQYPIDIIKQPFQEFIQQEKAGGIVLGISIIIALFLANSSLAEPYFEFLSQKVGLQFNGDTYFNLSILHWINDGLMAIFFFVVGLELKREIVGGELANPREALLPVAAAIGGVVFPAIIYYGLNSTGEASNGWGIPMATDIAFALGVLYLLGNKIPLSLKVFLTALAIVDDLVAVLVVAIFYTSDISVLNLFVGLGIVLVMFIGNRMGVRNFLFYGILGILGVWVAFLLSGVHATIAAVMAAFTIPADVKIKENTYIGKIQNHLKKFKSIDPVNDITTLTDDQLHILDGVKQDTNRAIPPLQRLEHAMHPFVTFLVIPIFALANAGVSLTIDLDQLFSTNVFLGIVLGLLVGKVLGIMGFSFLLVKLKVAYLPKGMNWKNLFGLSLLASIGLTMSLFITSMAFSSEEYIAQAKIGIFTASLIGGVAGYFLLFKQSKK
ncbi:MAG TPA: Na+/H+ antiporter NhaA [Aquaticitalea sp.]|nr:Na+/H+ antiporter NhaA [Aquaticitalea sp.]